MLDPREIARLLQEHRDKYLHGYRERVTDMITIARQGVITPVLVTQPALFGETIDPTTHVDLRQVQLNGRGNGLLEWRLLELNNDVTREVGAATGVTVIDLAKLMPKDSRYFYDYLHLPTTARCRSATSCTRA